VPRPSAGTEAPSGSITRGTGSNGDLGGRWAATNHTPSPNRTGMLPELPDPVCATGALGLNFTVHPRRHPVPDASTPLPLRRAVVRGACPHDCPDTCALLVTVEGGRAVEVRGAADHPATGGVLCTKVARYLERTYSKQ